MAHDGLKNKSVKCFEYRKKGTEKSACNNFIAILPIAQQI